MNVIFRTNAGEEGLGHLNRTYSLYIAMIDMIKIKGCFVVNHQASEFLVSMGIDKNNIYISEEYNECDNKIYENLMPDIIVIDTYMASSNYIREIKKNFNSKIILFDDNNCIYSDIEVDIIINGNIYAPSLDYSNNIKYKLNLSGLNYLIMNPIYWKNKLVNSHSDSCNNRILITCGGADPYDVTSKLIQWTKSIDYIKTVVIGPYFQHNIEQKIYDLIDDNYQIVYKPKGLRKLIEQNDIIITASGSTVYEVLTLNKIPIIFVMGEDQKLIADELTKNGVINLGWYEDMDENCFLQSINNLINGCNNKEISNLINLLDGKGVNRVVNQIVLFLNKGD